MNLEKAYQVLNVPVGHPSHTLIFDSFIDQIYQPELEHSQETLIEAKNIIFRNIISKQRFHNPTFKLIVHGKNVCPICRGTGERYQFEHQTIQVPCYKCDATGTKIKPCWYCRGSGKLVKNGKQVFCRYCKGTGKYIYEKCSKRQKKVDCPHCKGNGHLDKIITTSKIRSTTKCEKCEGIGIIEIKQTKGLGTFADLFQMKS